MSCPPGLGWTRDPFGGEIADGRLVRPRLLRHEGRPRRGGVRGRSDSARRHHAPPRRSKSAARSTKRAADLPASRGSRKTASLSRERTKAVIIPEPFGVDRVCVGHRGVYWFEVIARGPHRARQHAVSRHQRDRRHVAPARPGPRRAWTRAVRPGDDDAGGAGGIAARHHQHQRHRRRTAGRRHAESVRGRSLPGRCSIAAS